MVAQYSRALIVGAGNGLSAAIARRFAKEGMAIALAARNPRKLDGVCKSIGAKAFACDASVPQQVNSLFEDVAKSIGDPDVVVFNASARVRGPVGSLAPVDVERALSVGAFGGFLVAREAARLMLPKAHGAILFTGASASVKGFAESSPFAMAKFALRGLAQSLARELHPQGIHVGHFVIDGGIASQERMPPADRPDSMLDPGAIAESYLHLLRQDRSAWTWEMELRPWVEKF